MDRKLEDVLKDFDILPWGDTEGVHSRADDLVMEGLMLLGEDGQKLAHAWKTAEHKEDGFWYA